MMPAALDAAIVTARWNAADDAAAASCCALSSRPVLDISCRVSPERRETRAMRPKKSTLSHEVILPCKVDVTAMQVRPLEPI